MSVLIYHSVLPAKCANTLNRMFLSRKTSVLISTLIHLTVNTAICQVLTLIFLLVLRTLHISLAIITNSNNLKIYRHGNISPIVHSWGLLMYWIILLLCYDFLGFKILAQLGPYIKNSNLAKSSSKLKVIGLSHS